MRGPGCLAASASSAPRLRALAGSRLADAIGVERPSGFRRNAVPVPLPARGDSRGLEQSGKPLAAGRVLLLPGDERKSVGVTAGLVDVGELTARALGEDRVAGSGRGEALVDDPGVGMDAGAGEIVSEASRFVNRGSLGKSDK